MAKKIAKSIFGKKSLETLGSEQVPPDKKDYLEDYFETELEEKKAATTPKAKAVIAPIEEVAEQIPEDTKSYKSYYAHQSSHETFRDLVHTLRHLSDPDYNNGVVFDEMVQYFKQHVEKEHGKMLKAGPPKRGRK